MPMRREDRPGGFAQIVELAELVRHAGQGAGDCLADGVLPGGDAPQDGHDRVVAARSRERVTPLRQQWCEIILRRTEQATGQQHRARAHVAQYPQHFMPHVRLQAV
jgi:hypothetical protein